MIKVIFTISAILFITITSVVNHKDKVKLQNKTLVEAYPAQAEEYLENKYEEKFDINPNYDFRPSGPIPGDTDFPYIYRTQEKDGNQYMFRTYVYPMADNDKNIKTIEDGYYWKTIEKETKKFMEDKMQGLLPKEYKILFIVDPQSTFEGVDLTLPMETYFSTLGYQLSFWVYIVIPPNDGTTADLLIKENVYPIIDDYFKMNSGNVWIKFVYYRAETEEDYQKINVGPFESSIYMGFQEYRRVWSSVKLVEKLRVEIK